MLRYQDLLDIGLSADADELHRNLALITNKLGFGLFGGTLIRGRLASGRAAVHSFQNAPDAFVETCRSLDVSVRDPLLTAISARQGCHVYDQQFYTKAGAGDLWDNQAPFGYRFGMAISLHEFSHAEMFCFGVDGPDRLPTSENARSELEGALRLVALHGQEAALRIFSPTLSKTPSTVDLEPLRWAADAQVVSRRGEVTLITKPGQPIASRQSRAVLRAIDGGLIKR